MPEMRCDTEAYQLEDVAPIFNLIQQGSAEGHFCNLYLEPRYMAGLGIQLFSLLWFNRIKLPNDGWYRVTTRVLRVDGRFAGFIMIRHAAFGEKGSEIYMMAIEKEYRRQGLGELILRQVVAERPIGHRIFAHCLPESVAMIGLVKKLGFQDIPHPLRSVVSNFFRQFVFA